MSTQTGAAPAARQLVTAAAVALKARAEEVNRLNVFPVPDGDTGTNMSLTMDTVVRELGAIPDDASISDACRAVTHGSLMGARGNSGVILSQILRGMCEGLDASDHVDTATLADALEQAVTVSFQAVRKPVEGTMLTVIKDSAAAARLAVERGDDIDAALERVTAAAFESVRRTPELLPVLKENGVVDAGGFGLALLIEGFTAAAIGRELAFESMAAQAGAALRVEPVDDWDDQEYLYCTEFLLFGEDVDRTALEEFISSAGGSELVVGAQGEYKVHVHTNDPGSVLTHVSDFGELAEVHVNNMRRQQASRDQKLKDEAAADGPTNPVGVVAVASGSGLTDILKSLGVDVVVSGGQTMNPSTEDLLEAIRKVPADSVIVLPNNKNIVMAANAAAGVSEKPAAVVPTTSIPAAFSALLEYSNTGELDALVPVMTEAAATVHTGEITVAVKDAKAGVGEIHAGQVIGILDDDEIVAVGESVDDVAFEVAGILGKEAETLTLFAGEEYSDDALAAMKSRLEQSFPELEVEAHRGEQPLYPLIMSAE